jgi:hypothetical protein
VTVKKFDATSHAFLHALPLLRFSQGDRAGALRAYSHGRAVLADQLQVEPEPETVALAKRIRHTSPVRSTSFGSFFAPHTSPGQPPTNLLNGAFLARTAEFSNLIECYQRVAAGQPEFVLLKGETGIGKTHLARAFAGWAQVQRADELHGPNRLFEATTRLLQRWAARRPLVLLLDFFEEMTTRMGIKNVSHIVAMHK